MSKRRNVHTGKVAVRLAARIKSYNEGQLQTNKISATLRKPGSQNRKK
jgi:hypothetical protein